MTQSPNLFKSPIVTNTMTSLGGIDIFMAQYDLDGNTHQAKSAGAPPAGHANHKSINAGSNDQGAFELVVYPNPTSGKITLSTSGSQQVINSIYIFDMVGKEVRSWQLAACLPAKQISR